MKKIVVLIVALGATTLFGKELSDGEIRNWMEIVLIVSAVAWGLIKFLLKLRDMIKKDEDQEKRIAGLEKDMQFLKDENASHKKDFEMKSREMKRLTDALEKLNEKLDSLLIKGSK
jgi:septal ring factor EnvC (AmiA/AmiB activator)